MNVLPHIDDFQLVLNLAASIVKIAVLTVIDMLLHQSPNKAFAQTILGGAGFVRHADLNAMFQQAVGVQLAGMLGP